MIEALARGHADYGRTACGVRAEKLSGMVGVAWFPPVAKSGGTSDADDSISGDGARDSPVTSQPLAACVSGCALVTGR